MEAFILCIIIQANFGIFIYGNSLCEWGDRDWLYRVVGGVEIAQPGYRHSIIAPEVSSELKYASSSTMTPYGEIKSSWNQNTNFIEYHIEVPVNTRCIFQVPSDFSKISSDDIDVNSYPKQTFSKGDVRGVGFELGSGSYSFRVMR